MNNNYDDIIFLPHHQSKVRARMSKKSRAAQFAPFAALTGYDDAVTETARLTEPKKILGEDEIKSIDQKLQHLFSLKNAPKVSITYFEPDKRKAGGSYKTVTGALSGYKEIKREIRLEDGTAIPVDDIISVDGSVLPYFDSIIC